MPLARHSVAAMGSRDNLLIFLCSFLVHGISIPAPAGPASGAGSRAEQDGSTSLVEVVSRDGREQQAVVFGNVKTVLDGASTGTSFRKVAPGTFWFALGAASVSPDAGIQGETFVLGGRVFVKETGEQTGYATRSDTGQYWAGFLAGLPPEAVPSAHYRIRPQSGEGVPVERIYAELARSHPGLTAVFGSGKFDEIDASAVKRAPAYEEPILGANQRKYFHPTTSMHEINAVFFGLLLSSVDAATSETRLVFYVNPQDKGTTGVQSHTHFARLQPGASVDLRNPAALAGRVEEVAHLLTQSRMEAGELYVYDIGQLEAR